MAIDNAEKRKSAIGPTYHYYNPGVTPNAGTDEEWRTQSGHGYSGFVGQPAAAISGTAAVGLTESQVVAGSQTIIITLTNDTWVTAGATFNAQRQNIIDGITSAQSEATGWNNEVRDNEVVGSVVRTSDTVVTITLSAAPAYDVTSDESITVTVPASALVTSASAVVATPALTVTADVEAVANAGGITKARKRAGPRRFLVEIDGQFFDADSVQAVQAQLEWVRKLAKESAETDATKEALKPESNVIRIAPPKVRVTENGKPAKNATITRDVQRTQRLVNRAYAKARQEVEEIRQLATRREARQRRIAKRKEEEAIVSLLL